MSIDLLIYSSFIFHNCKKKQNSSFFPYGKNCLTSNGKTGCLMKFLSKLLEM